MPHPPLRGPLSETPRLAQRPPLRATRTDYNPAADAAFVQGEALFLACLPVIDDVTAQSCRRHRLSGAEAADFRSDVRLHFIERDYEVLRRFEGRSSLATYVTVVIQRLFLDYRNRQWGKWRPSAEARRLGPTAVLLERLVSRDGWTPDQAMEMLRVNHGVEVDAALQDLCTKLASRRPGRQFVSEDEARQIHSDGPGTDVKVVRAEQDFLAKRVQSALDRSRQALEAEDRLILRMRFEDGLPVADIARALHLDQKRLYRRIDRLLAGIGRSLEAEGISRAGVQSLLAEGVMGCDQAPIIEEAMESKPGSRPAERVRSPWLRK